MSTGSGGYAAVKYAYAASTGPSWHGLAHEHQTRARFCQAPRFHRRAHKRVLLRRHVDLERLDGLILPSTELIKIRSTAFVDEKSKGSGPCRQVSLPLDTQIEILWNLIQCLASTVKVAKQRETETDRLALVTTRLALRPYKLDEPVDRVGTLEERNRLLTHFVFKMSDQLGHRRLPAEL